MIIQPNIPHTDLMIDMLSKSGWVPYFDTFHNVEKVVDLINLPHEDYPHRIPATNLALEILYEGRKCTERKKEY